MSWPSPQEYNEAIQNPALAFKDEELAASRAELNSLGLPRSITGGSASVYKMRCKNRFLAVRCFLRPSESLSYRYARITSHLATINSAGVFLDFDFLDKGIKVKGEWFPCLKMQWFVGETLDRYLAVNYRDGKSLFRIIEWLEEIAIFMKDGAIAHGDLQHGNILLSPTGMRLIDYDSMFVPALETMSSIELGHPNYQHPLRDASDFDIWSDNFSLRLINSSLSIIAIDPSIYESFNEEGETIIFREKDLSSPEQSLLFEKLLNHKDARIREEARLLKIMLQLFPREIPFLDGGGDELEKALALAGSDSKPRIASLTTNRHHEIRHHEYDSLDSGAIYKSAKEAVSHSKHSHRSARNLPMLNSLTNLMDGVLTTILPIAWLNKRMSSAENNYRKKNIDAAIRDYMSIFSSFENKLVLENKHYHRAYFESLFGLGRCFVELQYPELAANYLKLASSRLSQSLNSEESGAGTERERMRLMQKADFILALLRLECGNREEALKILERSECRFDYLSEILIEDSFVLESISPSHAIDLLTAAGDRISISNHEKASNLLYSAFTIFTEVCGPRLLIERYELTNSFLHLLWLLQRKGDLVISSAIFFDLHRLCEEAASLAPMELEEKLLLLSRVSLLCAASLQVYQSEDEEWISMLSRLDDPSEDQFEMAVFQACNYVPVSNIMNLLLKAALSLEANQGSAEAMICMKAACRLSCENEGSSMSALVSTLIVFEPEIQLFCLSQTFLLGELDELDNLRSSNQALIVPLVKNYLRLGDISGAARLVAYLYSKDRFKLLERLLDNMIADSSTELLAELCACLYSNHELNLLAKTLLDKTQNYKLRFSCALEIERLIFLISSSHEKMADSRKNLERCLKIIDLMSELNTEGEVDRAMKSLFAESNTSVTDSFILYLARTEEKNRLFSLLFKVFMHAETNAGDRILLILLEHGHEKFVQEAFERLSMRGCRSLLSGTLMRLKNKEEIDSNIAQLLERSLTKEGTPKL